MEADRAQRSRVHSALADPSRLAIVDELSVSDRAPSELAAHLGLAGNLLAHHLDVLEQVGLIRRFESSGDRRRRYVRLEREPLRMLGLTVGRSPTSVLFVCTHNSARSQLAAAAWNRSFGVGARSAGTHPADRVHPGAVAAARRAGLELAGSKPRHLDDASPSDVVVTVCDRAHEELEPARARWHWSIPDPVPEGTDRAFDDALADIETRITCLSRGRSEEPA